jgi:hypothetical protein
VSSIIGKPSDPPQCTACGYLLIGLLSSHCPECGADVISSPEFNAPRLVRTPWSAVQPQWLPLGIARVLLAPVKTLSACASRRRVTVRRAFFFSLMVSGLLVLAWPVIKEGGLSIANSLSSGTFEWHQLVWPTLSRELTRWFRWRTYCGWEAWSITRWWLLFGLLALVVRPGPGPSRERGATSEVLCRVMLFAPWIALLELGHLFGVWVVEPSVVPEPNTLFAIWPDSLTLVWTDRYWLTRGVAPTFLVGVVFARAVLGRRWLFSMVFAAVLVPLGLLLSVLWTCLFMSSGLIDVLYRW